ncbi:hypothetical protein FI667_g4603, partial [Globisporangium splendens]
MSTDSPKPSSRKQQQIAGGDGALESIQLWEASAERKQHAKRIEQRLRVWDMADLEANYVEEADRKSYQQQQAQVEAVARTVNALSEEMCSQEVQRCESEAQIQGSLDKLQEELHGELVALESRFVSHADTIKDSCTTLITNVEKRLKLLEEELSICLKVAFDQEVLVIHELLRDQQKTLDTRLDDTLTEMKSVIETQAQSKLVSVSEQHDKRWRETQQDCEQRHIWWVAEQQELLSVSQHEQLAHMEEKLQIVAINFNEIAATNKAWLAEVRKELHEAQQRQQSDLSRGHETARQRMKEELEHQMLAWTKSVPTNWNELHAQVKAAKSKLEVTDQVQSDLGILKTAAEDAKKDVATSLDALEQRWQLYSEAKLEEPHSRILNEVQQRLALVDPATRSKQERVSVKNLWNSIKWSNSWANS